MRSTRKQPFCWQEKKINRLIREIYKTNKVKMTKMLLLYSTLTEIDSDFNWQEINFYTKTIVTYSWLNIDIVPGLLKELENLNILKIIEKKNAWMFAWKELIFTPDNVIDPKAKSNSLKEANSTVTEFSGNGESDNGKSVTGNSSTGEVGTLEDNIPSEDIINKNNTCDEKKIVLLLQEYKFNNKDINYLISNYSLSRISEVLKECWNKKKDNPPWFIKNALKEKYDFTNNKKTEKEKKELADKKYETKKILDDKDDQKKIAQNLKSKFEKSLVDDWIINNKIDYDKLYKKEEEKYNSKLVTNKWLPKNWSILIRVNVRSIIKKEFLWL